MAYAKAFLAFRHIKGSERVRQKGLSDNAADSSI